ncbi:MAG TPA: class I SAM-dependent methyltransferase, partial [Rhizobiales bacterium]|nr:class I SAM-dependent methyltransferase [Hyphomicrobiales bacterium]
MTFEVEMNEPCRLCGSKATETFAEANKRHYLRCETCLLVFVIQDELPDLEVERAEYGLHHNDPADQGYRTHLSKLTRPLVTGIPVPAHGLDFGCGPGPTISVMLAEQGFDMADYDPAFFPDEALLQKQYDFVSCTEVVEHFYNPGRDFELLARLLKPGGRFGIMTQLLSDDIDFEHWYYAREI